jgi:hypothetical protein
MTHLHSPAVLHLCLGVAFHIYLCLDCSLLVYDSQACLPGSGCPLVIFIGV